MQKPSRYLQYDIQNPLSSCDNNQGLDDDREPGGKRQGVILKWPTDIDKRGAISVRSIQIHDAQ